jgi:WD40 repeat protein
MINKKIEKSKEFRKEIKAKSDYGQVLDMPKDLPPTTRASKTNEEEPESEHSTPHSTTGEAHHHHDHDHDHDHDGEHDHDHVTAEDFERVKKTPIVSKSPIFAAKPEGAAAATTSGGQQVALYGSQQYALSAAKKSSLLMPKPQWHAPWKLYRVISGHLGWVRCIDVDPSNEWFVTGATDRIIKVSLIF